MGVGVLIGVGVSLAIAGIGVGIAFSQQQSLENDSLSPTAEEDFQVTLAKENTSIPIIYGRVRLRIPNIIFWGNLKTVEIKAKKQGKGGGAAQAGGSGGFKYFADVWKSLCHVPSGSMALNKYYVADREETINASSIDFNDGTDNSFPEDEAGVSSNRLPFVSHVFFNQWFMGENIRQMPNVDVVLTRTLPTDINNANMANGSNPAAIIYDILIVQGALPSEIDLSSFNQAADYFFSKGYGLNFIFDRKQPALASINKILSQVDGSLTYDSQARFKLRAYQDNDTSDHILDKDDFVDFIIENPSFHKTHNVFTGTYIDETLDFTTKVVARKNEANIDTVGFRRNKEINLKGFRDLSSASKRLAEILKRESFPRKIIKFKTGWKFSSIVVGDVVSISHVDYGFSSVEFRVNSVDQAKIDEGVITFKATLMIETLFDDTFFNAGDSTPSTVDTTPIAFSKVRYFELPFNRLTLGKVSLLMLVSREKLIEIGFKLISSNTLTGDYFDTGFFRTFSLNATLISTIPNSNHTLDDDTEITITPYKDDPEFLDFDNRIDLFSIPRFAIIDDEIIGFQHVQTSGSNLVLSGLVRGVLNTPISSHSISSEIWLTSLEDNIITKDFPDTVFFQMLSVFNSKILPTPTTIKTVTIEKKASKPVKPQRVQVIKAGSTNSITIWPISNILSGAGVKSEEVTDEFPHKFIGDFLVDDGTTGDVAYNESAFDLTKAGAFTLTVKHRTNGFVSAAATVTVGASDDTYLGE